MQSIVEVVCRGGSKSYNTIYTDPGYCKMVIVQDDEKFPSPRLCLLRKWPNFDGGFGFHLYEDLLNSTGALKIEDVISDSPAEAGGLRSNDVIIEINGDNIEYKSFFRLIEILKDAFSQQEMELLVLTEMDAEWYRERNICVNSNFPNIEYCETPYYGHKLKQIDSLSQVFNSNGHNTPQATIRITNPQIEFHSSTGKLYRTTLVIDNKNKDSKYTRIEELPFEQQKQQQEEEQQQQQQAKQQAAASGEPVRVYYRKGFSGINATQDETSHVADSGHGSMSARRSTPISVTNMSPYSTLSKSCGENIAVDLLHDKWADLMDKYLDAKYRGSSATPVNQTAEPQAGDSQRGHVILLNNDNNDGHGTGSRRSRSQNPTSTSGDNSFSFLFSGRDDYTSPSPTPQQQQHTSRQSPYHQRQSRSQPRLSSTSPQRSSQSPHTSKRMDSGYSGKTTPTTSQFESHTTTTTTSSSSYRHQQQKYIYQQETVDNREKSPYRAPHSIILRPKVLSQSLGFQLDEKQIIENNNYYVKSVDGGTPSASAGLKPGDKITKINGKPTTGMSYEDFCTEVEIAQRHHQRHNTIHLMVMRKSLKTAAQSSVDTSTQPSTVLPIYTVEPRKDKSPSPSVANIVNVIRVATPTEPSQPQQPQPQQQSRNVRPVGSGSIVYQATPVVTASVSHRQPNVIYSHEVRSEDVQDYIVQESPQTTTTTGTQQKPISSLSKLPLGALAKLDSLAESSGEHEPPQRERETEAVRDRQPQRAQQQASIQRPIIKEEEDTIISKVITSTVTKETQQLYENIEQPRQSQAPVLSKDLNDFAGNYCKNLIASTIASTTQQQQQQQPQQAQSQRVQQYGHDDGPVVPERSITEKMRNYLDEDVASRRSALDEIIRRGGGSSSGIRDEYGELNLKNSSSNTYRLSKKRVFDSSGGSHPFQLGIRLKRKDSLSDVGNHYITRIEPGSSASALGLKPNTKILKINGINMDNKTHEFLLSYLNKLLIDPNVSAIEMVVSDEPSFVSPSTTTPPPPPTSQYIPSALSKELISSILTPLPSTSTSLDTMAKNYYDGGSSANGNGSSSTDNIREIIRQVLNKTNQEIEQPQAQKPTQEPQTQVDRAAVPSKVKPRVYHVDRNPEYFGFGIILHTDRDSQQVQDGSSQTQRMLYPSLEIVPDSPAALAGLKSGQRLVGINGKLINRDYNSIDDLAKGIDDSYYQKGSIDFHVVESDVWASVRHDQRAINSIYESVPQQPQPALETLEFSQVAPPVQPPQQQLNESVDATSTVSNVNDKMIPRFCRLNRDTREEQYGFDFKTLKNDGIHIATNVRDNQPAQKAGLRNGDYIIEVNGKSIEQMEHESVVNLIFSNYKQVDLLVVEDLKGYKKNRKEHEKMLQQEETAPSTSGGESRGAVVVQPPAVVAEAPKSSDVTRHRITLMPTYQGIGLHLNYSGVINYIEPGSPAQAAGLSKNQRIVEVNDVNVRGKTNREIAEVIKENLNSLVVGVESAQGKLSAPSSPKSQTAGESRERDATIAKLVASGAATATPIARPLTTTDNLLSKQTKATSESALNDPGAVSILSPSASVSPKSGKQIAGSLNKLNHHHHGGLTKNLKNKFGSCLGLHHTSSSRTKDIHELQDIIDNLATIRVCNLVSKPGFTGFGFALRKSDAGPHQIANIEANSPALLSGLKNDDLLLKVNSNQVVGERYSKTVSLIKSEAERGLLTLEVIEPASCPKELREAKIVLPPGYNTVSSAGKLAPIMASSVKERPTKDGVNNLKEIVKDLDGTTPSTSGTVRSTSEAAAPRRSQDDTAAASRQQRPTSASPPTQDSARSDSLKNQNQQRPFSMNDLSTIDPKLSVRSAGVQSFGSTLTGLSQGEGLDASHNLARSTPNLPYTTKNTPKFKRITIASSPNHQGFGFTINSQVKPKYMIFDVDANSPAELAGLERSDILIEVNGKNIRRSSFDKVRFMLSQAYLNGKVEILVISKEGYLWFKERKKRFSSKLANNNNVEVYSNLNLNESMYIDAGNQATSSRLIEDSPQRLQDSQQHVYANEPLQQRSVSPPALPQQQSQTVRSSGSQGGLDAENELIRCTMRRIEGFGGYGMSISTPSNKSTNRIPVPVVTKVEIGSPAEIAGLRERDQIVEINGKSTYQQGSDFIANLIRNSRDEVDLVLSREKPSSVQRAETPRSIVDEQRPVRSAQLATTTDESGASRATSPNIIKSEMSMSSSKIHIDSQATTPDLEPRLNQSNTSQSSVEAARQPAQQLPRDAPVPRLCRIRTYEPNLGFVVSGSKQYPGIFKVADIQANSPAYNSGLRNDDYIIEISGTNVDKLNYDEVINLIKIKKDDDDLQLLVADKKTLEWYQTRDEPIQSRILPKLTYIETLLNDEMQFTLTDSNNTMTKISQESLSNLEHITTNAKFLKSSTERKGITSYIIRKVYL